MNSTPHSIVRTKAGRERIAAAINALAEKIGATIERSEHHSPREIVLHMKRDGYSVMMIFEGGEPIDVFLAHWNVDCGSDVKYPMDFPVGGVNSCHQRKATSQAATLEGLLLALETGFAWLKKDEAK